MNRFIHFIGIRVCVDIEVKSSIALGFRDNSQCLLIMRCSFKQMSYHKHIEHIPYKIGHDKTVGDKLYPTHRHHALVGTKICGSLKIDTMSMGK